MTVRATAFLDALLLAFLLGFTAPTSAAQSGVNVTTWHQDIPAICTGCVYRTGQNLNETKITESIDKTSFGQYCNAALDGQVFGQPLVVTKARPLPCSAEGVDRTYS